MSSHSSNTQRLQNRSQAGRASTGHARPMSPTMRFALVYVLALVVSLAVWFFYVRCMRMTPRSWCQS